MDDTKARLEALELRMDILDGQYKEYAADAKQKLNDVHDTVSHLDNFVRNGMSHKLTQVATTQKTLWWLVTAVFISIVGIAFTIIRTHILETLK